MGIACPPSFFSVTLQWAFQKLFQKSVPKHLLQILGCFLYSLYAIFNAHYRQNLLADDNAYHMSESWVDHFRSVLSSTSDKITFNQIQLATFHGHSAAIRKLVVLDNENSFISGSQDKTIKLWSIKNTEEYSTAQVRKNSVLHL